MVIGWLNCIKDIIIGDVNILLYKTLTSCIICICLTLFGYSCVILVLTPFFFLFFCLYYAYDQVCCSCSLDIH
ncbi:unnamed protein product [Lupinus luteus]|uniref:Uncharacterized protein n=1 Tax=Lupinus luteus TaxID=3873 RepID=A0AAV1W6Z6_LUPLU